MSSSGPLTTEAVHAVVRAELDVVDAVAEGLIAADFDHFCGGVDGNDFFGTLGE